MANSMHWPASGRVTRAGEEHGRWFHVPAAVAGVATVVTALAIGATVRLLVPWNGALLNGLRGKVSAFASGLTPRSCVTYPPGVDEQW